MRIVLLFLVLGLSACQSPHHNSNAHQTPANRQSFVPFVNDYHQRNDSAPVKPIAYKDKQVKPQDEPLSRYGNPQSYHVLGKSYSILRTTKGYKERGLASWYGTKFHKYRTSSGEPYDMYAMTAAHKTLPLPSYVRVKNLSNGREAIVRVNDRGPFHSGRIIDLSYAAANKLGIMAKGTAPVEVEAFYLKKPGQPDALAQYYVQAGAFETEKPAYLLKNQIVKALKAPAQISHHQARYIVRVGPYSEKMQSERIKQKLMQSGIKGAFTVLQ